MGVAYVLIESGGGVVSRHKTLEAAKKKLNNYKPKRSSKGVSIFKVI